MTKAKPKTLVLVAAFAAALFAGATSPSLAFLDKTRFVAHLGVAYFCFHHWVLKPYQAGSFNAGTPHRTATIIKGGVALLFAVHEIKVADNIAKKSSSPLLQKLDSGLLGLQSQFGAIGAKLKGGQFDPKDIGALSGAAGAEQDAATAAGTPIKDVPAPSIPGT